MNGEGWGKRVVEATPSHTADGGGPWWGKMETKGLGGGTSESLDVR